ncbi:MAG: 50S ribosomal protein L16 [Bacteroidota bacterium]|nr:50S ribosomal protein L16 [Bacteroidota bacterium]
MLQPKKPKYRKVQKGRIKGIATRGTTIAFGTYALKSLEPTRLTSNQLEAARVAIMRYIKREGKLWLRVFPDKPITKKPAEVRMGKGKGAPEYFVAAVRPGKIIFELEGMNEDIAKRALALGAQKLPVITKFISRKDLSA